MKSKEAALWLRITRVQTNQQTVIHRTATVIPRMIMDRTVTAIPALTVLRTNLPTNLPISLRIAEIPTKREFCGRYQTSNRAYNRVKVNKQITENTL